MTMGATPGRPWLPDRRATVRESVAQARERIREAARQQQAAHRAALPRVDAMDSEERNQVLEQLRRGERPSWLPAYNNPIYQEEP